MNKPHKPAVFEDKIIAISPKSFTKKIRDSLIAKVVDNGGCPVENVNPKVHVLVCSAKEKAASEVLEAASRFKIRTVSEEWITESLKQRKLQSATKFNPFGEEEEEEEEEEGEEEEAEQETQVGKRKSPSSSSSSSSSKKVRFIKKGRSAVDPNAPSHLQKNAHVYEEDDDIYDVMLNQTNISHNNNKFYVLQLLEDDNKSSWWVWTRWGRVGVTGQKKPIPFSNLDKAKNEFNKKFREKTANDFDDRADFQPVKGKYTMVELDYGDKEDEEEVLEKQKEALAKASVDEEESKLDERVQYLIKLICNLDMMKESLVEMEFDINKMPLGKLKKSHIQRGYVVLKKIEKALGRKPLNTTKLLDLTNEFYSLIPHDFGMRRPPVLDTSKQLKKKMAMLEALGDIEIATSLLKGNSKTGENPIDSSYKALNAKLTPVEEKSAMYGYISEYIANTHAPTHTNYKLRLKELYVVERPGEAERFKPYTALGNQQLLWHGSRLTNWVGIISQGLRIAPPEAPSTGYMFGKGVYFADMVTKSANYCHANRANPYGVLLLSRVALGKTYDCTQAKYMDSNKPGFDSTKGCGLTGPDPKSNVTLDDGTVIPLGKPVPTGIVNTSLLYNEFIVYDVAQLVTQYLVVVEFCWNS